MNNLLLKKIEDDEIDENNEQEKSTAIAETILFLHNEFSLNSEIEDEYKDYTYMISAKNYNL